MSSESPGKLSLEDAINRTGESIIRKFRFSEASDGRHLDVHLQYRTPAEMQEDVEKEKARLIASRKFNYITDIEKENNIVQDVYLRALASTIHHFEPVTFRQLAAYLPLNPKVVAEHGGLDRVVEMDEANTLLLLRRCEAFKNWVERIVMDLSYFQDQDWEEQVKNSKTGAN